MTREELFSKAAKLTTFKDYALTAQEVAAFVSQTMEQYVAIEKERDQLKEHEEAANHAHLHARYVLRQLDEKEREIDRLKRETQDLEQQLADANAERDFGMESLEAARDAVRATVLELEAAAKSMWPPEPALQRRDTARELQEQAERMRKLRQKLSITPRENFRCKWEERWEALAKLVDLMGGPCLVCEQREHKTIDHYRPSE